MFVQQRAFDLRFSCKKKKIARVCKRYSNTVTALCFRESWPAEVNDFHLFRSIEFCSQNTGKNCEVVSSNQPLAKQDPDCRILL